jgi:hypothetical protein
MASCSIPSMLSYFKSYADGHVTRFPTAPIFSMLVCEVRLHQLLHWRPIIVVIPVVGHNRLRTFQLLWAACSGARLPQWCQGVLWQTKRSDCIVNWSLKTTHWFVYYSYSYCLPIQLQFGCYWRGRIHHPELRILPVTFIVYIFT